MSLQEKIKSLKASQAERVGKITEMEITEWGITLKFRSLTMDDQRKAEMWAKKNFRQRYEIATGVAMVCLAVQEDELPMTVENVAFLLSEPMSILMPIVKLVKEISGLDDAR